MAAWEYLPPASSLFDTRSFFLKGVVDRASDMLSSHSDWLKGKHAWIARLRPLFGNNAAPYSISAHTTSPQHDELLAQMSLWHKNLFLAFCSKGFMALNNVVVSRLGRDRFVLALDGYSALGGPVDLFPCNCMSHVAMRAIIKAADTLQTKVQFWFFLVDTNYQPLLPGLSHHCSLSVLWGHMWPPRPLEPFIYLGFNQMAHAASIATAREALTVCHLQKFGRPVSTFLITPPSFNFGAVLTSDSLSFSTGSLSSLKRLSKQAVKNCFLKVSSYQGIGTTSSLSSPLASPSNSAGLTPLLLASAKRQFGTICVWSLLLWVIMSRQGHLQSLSSLLL